MRRGWKILIGVLVVLAVLLAVNTVVLSNQTKEAEATVEGGQILRLPGGDVQVLDEGSPGQSGAPIVLLHCYACSLHWWDEVAPILGENHRVIRIDLLGHGGSQKPKSGYSMEEQAALVAGALDELEVQGAVVVGHSMGFPVAVALAQSASQLVDRLVNIDSGPSGDDCELPFLARLQYQPVIGQAMWRLAPDFAIRDGVQDAFAPGYDLESGFDDQVVDDVRALTYTAFKDSHEAYDEFNDVPLDTRVRQSAVPLLSIFGAEDQICDPESSQAAYQAVPGARVATVKDAGHSPNVEQPEEVAGLIEEFAADAGDDTIKPPPKDVGRKGPDKPRQNERDRGRLKD